MSVEPRRVCGFRQIGGIYLVGEGPAAPCGWLPHPLNGCALCDYSPAFNRGVQRVKPAYLFTPKPESGRYHSAKCDPAICQGCPIPTLATLNPPLPYVPLVWVGRQYTPATFTREAVELGVSRRIADPPSWLELGSWIFCAHLDGAGEDQPAVFYVFKLTRIERIRGDKSTTPDQLEEDRLRGWTTVLLPEADPDHNPDADSQLELEGVNL